MAERRCFKFPSILKENRSFHFPVLKFAICGTLFTLSEDIPLFFVDYEGNKMTECRRKKNDASNIVLKRFSRQDRAGP